MIAKPYDAPPGYDGIARLAGWTTAGENALSLDLETVWGRTARLRLEAVAPSILRWTLIPHGCGKLRATPIVVFPKRRKIAIAALPTGAGLRVEGAGLIVEIGSSPWSFRVLDGRGRLLLSDSAADVDGLGKPFVLPLGLVRDGRRTTEVVQSFALGPGEHLYGLGEKFTRLDKMHQRIVSWTVDALGSTSERSHKNVPFLWSTRGWGLFLDTGARIVWELGTRSTRSFTVRVEDSILDAYLIQGPNPEALLKRYTALTGRAPVPPKWSFGLWLSSGGTYRTQEAVERLVDGAAERGLPAGVIHIDPWWMRWRHYCDFRWDRTSFPQPESLLRKLHGQGLRLCLWEHPYISVESDLFEFGKMRDFFIKRPDGGVCVIDYGLSLAPRPDGIVRRAARAESWNARVAVVDLTHPAARAWFKDLHRPLLRMGVDVFKTDFGEDIPADAVFHDGRTGAVLHNLYPLLYNQAVAEVTQEERGYALVWGRSGTAGSQRHPVCWSGDPAADWDSLAATIRGGLSLGLSGIPFWSHDIGGYRGRPSPELYVRWAQFGLLSSHSRMHGDSPREPWAFGEEALRIVRRFVRLRYRLFPYLYSLAHEAALTGVPILRAMPLTFPGDANAHGHDLQFMLGPWFLIAPVVEPGGRRTVYLPAGSWFDFWTGKAISGPRLLDLRVPLTRVPLFVRAGAIVPTMRPVNRIPEEPIKRLIAEVWPGAASTYTLYEDEGRTIFRLERKGDRDILGWSGFRTKNGLRVLLKKGTTPRGPV